MHARSVNGKQSTKNMFKKYYGKKGIHRIMQIKEIDGQLHVVVDQQIHETWIRPFYLPVGNRFVYPKSWGKRLAGKHFLEFLMNDQQRIIDGANERILRLKGVLEEVDEWDDSEK